MIPLKIKKRVKTPTILQMEAVECGAASLAMILEYHGLKVPLEELRLRCSISRDGSKASNIIKAAKSYQLEAEGYKTELDTLKNIKFPVIIFWAFYHFMVLEGIDKNFKKFYVNDPANGRRVIEFDEFNKNFTGIVLEFKKGPHFKTGGYKRSVYQSLKDRFIGTNLALTYVILAGLFLVIPGLLLPIFSRIFVDNILVLSLHNWASILISGVILTGVVTMGLTWLQGLYLLRIETKLALVNSAKFFYHIFHLPIEFFGQRFAGDIAQRILLNDKVAIVLSSQLMSAFLNLISIIFYAILMFFYDVKLTLIVLAIACLNFVFLTYISRKRVDINLRLQMEKAKWFSKTISGLRIIETIKATGSENSFFEQWSGYQAKVINTEQKLDFWTQIVTAIPPFLTMISTITVLAIGSLRVMEGNLSLGMLIAFQSLMLNFLNPVTQMVNLGSLIQEIRADMNRLDDITENKIQSQKSSHHTKLNETHTEKLIGYLEFKNITFGYNKLEPPLIENFNLKIKPGGRVALVGSSGSGKSTIAKLTAGLYQPWEGEILLDNQPFNQIPFEKLTNSLAMVDQDIFMFNGSAKDNITLWNPSIPEKILTQAAQDASIHDDISQRQGGYACEIEEDGKNFSGGQKQRLEIARALVNNPSILILDEATSALDPQTEKEIDAQLRKRGCTCLIIAHRLSTIRDADEIIVLHQGKVVQRGCHEELKNQSGVYAELMKGTTTTKI